MKTETTHDTIGIDLGDKNHSICVLNENGDRIDERSMTNRKESLKRLSKKYPSATIAFEVGSHSPWISRLFTELGHTVFVANPRKLRAIYENDRKSDERDAWMLARLARVDPSLLHPIEHSTEQAQRDLLQVKLRDNLVRQRVDIVSSVRFTLKALGLRLASPKTSAFTKQARKVLVEEDTVLLAKVEPSLRVIDEITTQVKVLDKEIKDLCEKTYPETKRLMQIRGIGPITALSFVLTVGDPERFAKVRDVGAYLGLVPKRDQSGNSDKALPISKAGNAYMRRLLVSAAQYMLGPFGEECDLQQNGARLAARGGRGAKKKAVIATARKLSVVMLTLWKEESDYHPFIAKATS